MVMVMVMVMVMMMVVMSVMVVMVMVILGYLLASSVRPVAPLFGIARSQQSDSVGDRLQQIGV